MWCGKGTYKDCRATNDDDDDDDDDDTYKELQEAW
jgi:hypothetical protein